MVQTTSDRRPSHRGRLDIIASIVAAAVGGVRKTFIMYQCNLSFKQLEAYLGFLLRKRLLRTFTEKERATGHLFETTEKGRDFLKAYQNLEALTS